VSSVSQEYYGYAGHILYVDLSKDKVEEMPLGLSDIDLFLGGVGLAAKIIAEEIPDPRVDPLSPGNILVFMTGPLTGTPVYGSASGGKIPFNNGVGRSTYRWLLGA